MGGFKNNLYYLVLLCLSIGCSKSVTGQTSFDILPDVGGLDLQSQGWTLFLDSSEFFTLGDLLDTTNNGYEEIFPWLASFDYDGDLKRVIRLSNDGFENQFKVARNSVFRNSSGNFLILGSQSVFGTSSRPKLIEVEPSSGEILQYKFFSNPIDSTNKLTRNHLLFKEPNIIATSSFYEGNNYNYYISYLDGDFQLSQSNIISDKDSNNVVFHIEQSSDTSLYLVGHSKAVLNQSNFPNYSLFLINVSKDGSILKKSYFNIPGDSTISFSSSLSSTVRNDDFGNWVMSCVALKDNTDECQQCYSLTPITLSLSPAFDDLNWSIKFTSLAPTEESHPTVTSMDKCKDGSGFITAGFDTYSFVYKVNDQGDSLWLRKFIPLGWEEERALWTQMVDIKCTDSNMILLTGRVSDRENQVIRSWVLQMDSLGCVVPGCDNVVNSDDLNSIDSETFKVFPNPVRDKLYLLNKNSSPGDYNLIIAAQNGIFSRNLNFRSSPGEQYIIPVDGFPTGYYVINVFNENNSLVFQDSIIVQ